MRLGLSLERTYRGWKRSHGYTQSAIESTQMPEDGHRVQFVDPSSEALDASRGRPV